jgi:hypothetical protein
MSSQDEERQEDDVPALALEALQAAQRHAQQAGHTLVMVRDDQLIQICGETVTVLKPLQARKAVHVRTVPATP